jgi:hypothetical protein
MKSSDVFNLVGIGLGAFIGSLVGGLATKSPLGTGVGAGLGVLIGDFVMRVLYRLPKDEPAESKHTGGNSGHAP